MTNLNLNEGLRREYDLREHEHEYEYKHQTQSINSKLKGID